MYPVSAAYKTAIAQNVRNTKISGTITLIDDTIINITDEDIALGSLYLTEQCVVSEDIEIGNVYASELGFTLKSPPENPYSLDGARVLINFGINVGSNFEYVPLGYFYVTEIERKHTAASLKALDGMILFDTDLTGVLTGGKPRTIISSCCSKVGITLATDTAAFSTFANADVDFALPAESKAKTCRDLIMWVCQALGCFARMNRQGQLEIVPVRADTSGKTITKAQRFSSDVSDFQVKITKVAMTVGETEYAQGIDGMTMALEENPLLTGKQGAEINTILGNILIQVTQAEYTPYNVNFAGDPAIQAGDWITIPDTSVLGGGDVVSLVTHSMWRYRGPHNIRAAGKGALLRGVTGSQQEKAISTVVAIATAAQALAQAANQSTQLIKDAIGGHVLIRREPGGTNEILIMDHPDPEQAVKIWRWNMGGLGYSDNVVGADNPDREYTIAMTMDGAINADFVRTGEINTNLVKILGNSNFYWDGDYLYIVNPDDGNQQIRLSKEGIRFTQDGGQTWLVAMDFDGIRMEGQSQDGHTNYTGDGVKVYDEQGSLVGHLGSFEALGNQTATFTRNSVAYKQDGSQVAANVPRFEQGKFDKAVLVEEGTTNICTNPSFETDLTGWTHMGGGTSSRVTDQRYYGNACLKISTTDTQSPAERWYNVPSPGSYAGKTVTLSCMVKTSIADKLRLCIREYDGNNYKWSSSSRHPGDGTWKKLSLTTTLRSTVTVLQLQIIAEAGIIGDFWCDGVLFEEKPYPTSFTPGTRSPETLTIPTAGVLNSQEGAVVFRAWLPEGPQSYLFTVKGNPDNNNNNRLFIYGVDTGSGNQLMRALIGTGSSFVMTPTISATRKAWHFIAVRWTATSLKITVDSVTEEVARDGIGTFGDLAYIGSSLGHTQANALIDELAIFDYAPTDEEIQAAYQSGQPLPVDEWTTWKSSFDGHLHNEVPVRKYGLMLKHGTIRLDAPSLDEGILIYDTQGNLRTHIGQYAEGKYGTKVINGEIYSTLFRTGKEDDTTYIELNQDGVLKCIKSGNRTVQLDAYASDGRLVLYRYDGEESCYLNAYYSYDSYAGVGLSAINRYDADLILASGGARLVLHGTGVRCNASGEFYINGNLWVTGSSKHAAVMTEHYGERGLSVLEMPDVKFMDEGVAQLENGLCRIDLDPIFLETIEPNTPETPFIVHLTPYDWLTLRVKEIGDSYFIVEEKDGLSGKFSWQLTAIRKGCAGIRLPERHAEEDYLSSNWEDEFVLTTSGEEEVLTSRWEDELID